MGWLLWSFCAGLALGALAARVLLGAQPPARSVSLGALAGGVFLLAIVALLARRRAGAPGLAARLASAAGVGLAALPALEADRLGLAPKPAWALAATLLVLAAALVAAARSRAGGGRARPLRTGGLALLAGGAVLVGVAGAMAAGGASQPGFREQWAPGIFDLDARVPTLPLPDCNPTPLRVDVLLDRGAHPRRAPGTRWLWFDATAPDATRQVYRLDTDTGRVECPTCGEPGNNWDPAPDEAGTGAVFATDRHATWWEPANVEVQLLTGAEGAPRASRRLTFSPGVDADPIFAPGSRSVVWSRQVDGRFEVVLATLRSAHGGVLLGPPQSIASGGASWIAPVAWSPDARALVLARGNPLAPRSVRALDLGTGESRPLAADVASGGSVAFDGDGGFAVLAGARRVRLAGLLPGVLGFLIAPLAADLERSGSLLGGTQLRLAVLAAPTLDLRDLELGEVARWGEPTGLVLAPDGREVILGQRRTHGEERLLRVVLRCDGAATD